MFRTRDRQTVGGKPSADSRDRAGAIDSTKKDGMMMRKSFWFPVTAALGLAVPILAGEFDGADARPRLTLNQCISNYDRCINRCVASQVNSSPWPPDTPGDAQWGNCQSSCGSNHSACVDLAMSSDAAARPPKRRPPVLPRASILETSPGFSPQAPSSTGTPVSTPPKQTIR
jgi:hypothetical protein